MARAHAGTPPATATTISRGSSNPAAVGLAVGEVVGLAELGLALGNTLGPLGDRDGLLLGEALGLADGDSLGLALGLALGEPLGDAEGLAVGRSVEHVPRVAISLAMHGKFGSTFSHSRSGWQSEFMQHPSPTSEHGGQSGPPPSTHVSAPFFTPSAHSIVVGLCEGDPDGLALGLALGLVDGDALGDRDGLELGLADGETDGDIDGLREGVLLGLALGLLVGDCDGDADGLAVGATVVHVPTMLPGATHGAPFGASAHSRVPAQSDASQQP